LREEVQVVEEHDDGVFGHGLVEGRGDLHERVVRGEVVGAGVGADDWDETFRGDVVY
jgi:hypothetical protein